MKAQGVICTQEVHYFVTRDNHYHKLCIQSLLALTTGKEKIS